MLKSENKSWTVEELLNFLKQFPMDAQVYIYDHEFCDDITEFAIEGDEDRVILNP